jgi:iron complex outermembrane receptor protein
MNLFVHSTEIDRSNTRRERVPLTPRHTAGIDLLWEREGRSRIGIEAFYTGWQHLEDNPYRTESIPYWVFGILLERRFGPARVYLNGENLMNFRQTRHDRLVRPTPTFDGRRTVDAWAPLEGVSSTVECDSPSSIAIPK